MTEIKKVGEVGPGTMGSSIAALCAQFGYETIMWGRRDQSIAKGMKSIHSSLERRVARGKVTEEEKDALLSRLRPTTKLEDLRECDIIIEAIVEQVGLKREIFAALDRVCAPHAILASSTSSIPIMEMAMATQRPERVIGFHFSYPAHFMKILEMVKTILSSEEVIHIARGFAESLGKTVIISKDAPGFILNRLRVPYWLDAVRLLESGFASAQDIDTGMELAFGDPWGPLRVLDTVGIDTIYDIACAMYEGLKDPKYAPPPLMRQMVLAGQVGRKAGKGFYQYDKTEPDDRA